MIAMLVVGIVSLFLFAVWDMKFAAKPVIPFRFLRNRSVTLICLINFFSFVSVEN